MRRTTPAIGTTDPIQKDRGIIPQVSAIDLRKTLPIFLRGGHGSCLRSKRSATKIQYRGIGAGAAVPMCHESFLPRGATYPTTPVPPGPMHNTIPSHRPIRGQTLFTGWLTFSLFAAVLACYFTLPPALSPRAAAGEDQSDQEALSGNQRLGQRLRCLARAGVERWHARGHRGRGVKVAILDSGFRGYRDQLGKSLPATVTVKSFRVDGNLEAKDSKHGILCAEVVHALAPEAELLLANWEADSPDRFIDAVRWARDQGARIMTCSVIMPSWSDGEGGGPVHEALAKVLGTGASASDGVCFASAGNTAKRHWSGTFHDHGDGLHEWKPGLTENALFPWGGGERSSIELCWKGAANYDLFVYEGSGEKAAVVASSVANPGEQRCSAVARFQPEPGKSYFFRVKGSAKCIEPFHCVTLHSGVAQFNTRGSICFPADGAEVVAVGAVDERNRRMSYSSCGPNSKHPKPDLVASVPFPSLWREKPFAGTSAAAPQAAGIAAVLWSRNAAWTAEKVRMVLRSSALDLGAPGHDVEFGYGLLRLPAE